MLINVEHKSTRFAKLALTTDSILTRHFEHWVSPSNPWNWLPVRHLSNWRWNPDQDCWQSSWWIISLHDTRPIIYVREIYHLLCVVVYLWFALCHCIHFQRLHKKHKKYGMNQRHFWALPKKINKFIHVYPSYSMSNSPNILLSHNVRNMCRI